MKVYSKHIVIVSILLMSVCMLSCNHADKLCCEQYNPDTPQSTYCNNHRNAALKFVRFVTEDSERIARLNEFKAFYETVRDCETIECIQDGINAAPNLPGFIDYYTEEHEYSERDTDLPQNTKPSLILCGFDQAIKGLEKTLLEKE
ncbi:MAG: hypothetical protein AB1746_10445 [Candidatus Zixiibacteriota bacterium]